MLLVKVEESQVALVIPRILFSSIYYDIYDLYARIRTRDYEYS